jgi:hypothetical protein
MDSLHPKKNSDEALSGGYNLKLTSSNIEMASKVHGDRKTG